MVKKTTKKTAPKTKKKDQLDNTPNLAFSNMFDDLPKLFSRMGRPKKFSDWTKKELRERVAEYFASCYTKQKRVNKTPDKIEKVKITKGSRKGKMKDIVVDKLEIVEEDVLIKTPTISGLCVYLDTNRRILVEIVNRGKTEEATDKEIDFSNTIAYAKKLILAYTEQQLHTGKNTNGVIFSLKNNRGSQREDTSKVENEHKISLDNMIDDLIQ